MTALDALFNLRFVLEAPVPNCQEVKNALNALSELTAVGGPIPRGEVLQADGYEIVCKAWQIFCDTGEFNVRLLTKEAEIIREATLRVLWTLTPGYPEIIDNKGFTMIFQAFDPKCSEATQIEALKTMRNICIKSEGNREALESEWRICEPFVNVVRKDHPSPELVREWCGALRTFVLNDDRRVPYNRAPERKRIIFQLGGHTHLARFLDAYNDVATLNAIINVLGIMASNEDMCIGIEAAGGLRGLQYVLQNYPTNVDLIKNTISAIRYLNISPTVREKCGGYNLIKPVLLATWRNRDDAGFLEVAMSCLAFMTIRSPCQVAQLLIEKGVFFITEMMKKHLTNVYVLKGACLTLRNVASSGGQVGRATIIDVQGETLLRSIAETHETLIENHVNPTLRDLGLETIATAPPPVSENEQSRSIPEIDRIEAEIKSPH